MNAAGRNSDVPAKAGVRTRIPIIYFVCFELAIGLGVSLGLFSLARTFEEAHSAQEFAARAEDRQEALQRSLDGAVEALYSVKALVESHSRVQREDFSVFAAHVLERHPELLSVEWLPRVTREERAAFTAQVRASGFPDFEIRRAVSPGRYEPEPESEEYFPVLYVEPLAPNRETLGFDPGTEPVRAAVMRRATDTMKASASEAVVLLRPQPGSQHPRAINLLAPVTGRWRGGEGRIHRNGLRPATRARC